MEEKQKEVEREIADLKQEMENFEKEKERVRSIVGKIGGVPTFNTRLFNVIFVILVLGCLIVSLLTGGTLRLAMIEAAIALLSLKLVYLIHQQSRVSHFQLWILSSLEWRLNDVINAVRSDKK